MLILSIDQAMSCSGYAWLLRPTKSLVVAEDVMIGTVTTKFDKKDPHNLKRLLYIYDTFDELVDKGHPDLIVIERYFVANSRGATAVSEVRAVLKLVAAKHDVPLKEYVASSVRKGLVGNGRAEKEEIASYILQQYPQLREETIGYKITLDETDALAMALHAMKVEENATTQTVTQTINHKKKGSRKASQKGKQAQGTAATKESSGQSVTSKKTKDSGTQTSFKETST